MKLLLIDVKNESVEEVEGSCLEEYYELLDCDIVEIHTCSIGGKEYAVICDEEARMRSTSRISAIDGRGAIVLIGNLLVANNYGVDGNRLASLTSEDIERIRYYIRKIPTKLYPQGYPMLTDLQLL